MDAGWLEMMFKGVTAGFLMATLVWVMPSAEGSGDLIIIVAMTYMIALGDFSHIVAGSVEAFLLIVNGQAGVGTILICFALPTLIGNIVGGSVLFTMLAYAQVHQEIPR